MPPRILITRPAPEALHWVRALQARGLAAQALPLIQISAPTDATTQARLLAAQTQIDHYNAIMVVSGQAARYFWTPKTVQTLHQLAHVGRSPRIWAPGPGTIRTLETLGIAPAQMDQPAHDASQFDSEALWAQVQGQISANSQVLIVRGSDNTSDTSPAEGVGREWLAQQLEQAGAIVTKVVAYQRTAPILTPAQQALAEQAAHDGSVWLFSSSQAVAHLQALWPAPYWQHAHALTTHPRIAAAAQALGFGTITPCRPALEDIAVSIESMP